jgi:hypothetical protein
MKTDLYCVDLGQFGSASAPVVPQLCYDELRSLRGALFDLSQIVFRFHRYSDRIERGGFVGMKPPKIVPR